MLSKGRIVLRGSSEYAHEQEALEFIRATLPDSDPYHVWELVELVDPSTGRLYEIDCLVLGYSALYLVEIKSGPGRYEGDTVDWYRTPPGGTPHYMEPPLRLTNHKCKVLKSLIEAKGARGLWVQPLVFLSHQQVELHFRNYGDQCVVTRANFLDAVKLSRFPGSEGQRVRAPVNRPQQRELAAALEAIGVRASQGMARVGPYRLESIIEEGPGYQDRRAVHAENEVFKRRARIYLVPQQTSVERRQQLKRAADRDAMLLEDVKDHPNVLRVLDYEPNARLGPTLLFDHFEGEPLDAFIRQNPDLGFEQRLEVVEQVARALEHCHKKHVIHAGLCPSAVLVRRDEQGKLHTRLYNFQLGTSDEVSSTRHWSDLAEERWAIYQAPELREDPHQRSEQADLFSLGALAYFVFTGKAPADSFLAVDQRLVREDHLDPRAASDGVPAGAADAVCLATCHKRIQRADDVSDWLAFLLDGLTRPEPAPAPVEPSPLEANKGDRLGGDLVVRRVLGQGASSRVLEVERESDSRSYALKVALGPDDDERLEREHAMLTSLRHNRIVQAVDRRKLGSRTCVLMQLAGETTLARELTREGPVSLDFASRYGEDLLSALEELEESQILHRDIKPANLGVGAVGKTRQHLRLFDFSLAIDLKRDDAEHARTHVSVGTAVYRDPFLRLRGAWDHSADRYGAAVTLHEMLTGVRPSFEPEGAALDPESKLRLAAERFDASVRERLIPFFERALHRSVEARFESAAEMRKAWLGAFQVPALGAEAKPAASGPGAAPPATDTPPTAVAPEIVLTDSLVRAVSADTLIEALPLSVRARNALDRAGLLRAADLLALPENRLTAVRGVGTRVAREILEFRERWQRLVAPVPATERPFFPGYRGDSLPVWSSGIEAELSAALTNAGLRTLSAVALASEQRVESIAAKVGATTALLRKTLERENARANARENPTTLEGWLEALLPAKKKSAQNLRVLFGLADPLAGELWVPVSRAAQALHVTTANLYSQLGKAKDLWAAHPALPELRRAVRTIVESAGGAMPAKRAAEALVELIPQDQTAPQALAVPLAALLVRGLGLVDEEDPEGLRWVRLDSGEPWLCASAALVPPLAALGRAADALAAREVLASPGEAARVLGEAVAGSPFEPLPPEKLTELAAQASRNAARSTRLEIYPRGLEPRRALELASAALTGEELSPEEIDRRVRARYPEAAPIPPRPELDALLGPFRLRWEPVKQHYERPGERRVTQHTSLPTSLPTLSTSKNALDPRYIALREFEDQLRASLERGLYKVLAVRADRAREAAIALTAAFGFRRVSVDEELLRAIQAIAARDEIDLDLIHQTDRLGRAGEDWPELQGVVEEAAERVASALFPAKSPLLLVQPGLLARFQLTGFLRTLAQRTRERGAAAVCLLVPAHDGAAVPRINDELTLPEVGLPQTLWVPPEWIKKQGQAA